MIAGRVGVRDEQVVIGAGATGVIMQVLHAVTSPGDRIVMTSPTFDGYPIFAQMARLESVTVPLDEHGHHDLDAMADAAAHARVVVVCRPHNPTGTVEPAADIERFLRRVPSDTVVLLDEAYVEFLVAGAPDRRACAGRAVPECGGAADLLEGLRAGRAADRIRLLRARAGPQPVDDAAAVRHRHHRPGGGRGLLRRGKPTAATDPDDRRGATLSADAAAVDGGVQHRRHANFVYLPPRRRPWREVFDGTGLQVRHYADGGVRITVGQPAVHPGGAGRGGADSHCAENLPGDRAVHAV